MDTGAVGCSGLMERMEQLLLGSGPSYHCVASGKLFNLSGLQFPQLCFLNTTWNVTDCIRHCTVHIKY